MWNLDFIKVVDERVDLNFSTSLFLRDSAYGDRHGSNSGYGSDHPTVASDVVSTGYMPFMLGFRANITEINDIKPFAGGSIGWGFSWDSVQSTRSSSSTHFFQGLAWQLNAGAAYTIGSSSDLYAKLFYNGSKWSSNKKEGNAGFYWNELNMSGIGMGLGIRLKY